MRIGVDATCWHNHRGYGRHARALLSALARCDTECQYTFFVDSLQNLETMPSEVEVCAVDTAAPTAVAASADGHRSARDILRMSRALSSFNLDVLLFPTAYSYIPVLSRAKKVVFIHDVIPETYPQLTHPRRVGRMLWNAKLALSRWQADVIVTVSEYSRAGIARRFNVPLDRISVVGEASDPAFRVLENPGATPHLRRIGVTASRRHVVYVGGFGPHKNIEALVSVFARLANSSENNDLSLVLVGQNTGETFHSQFEALKRLIEDFGISERVIFAGYLPDHELVVLLNLATVLVLPSLMEGFGLPAVEAAACGCPVVATTASPLPQILGDGGLYFDPYNWDDLELALSSVLSSPDLRKRMREAGVAATQRLSWDTSAKQMKCLLHEVATR